MASIIPRHPLNETLATCPCMCIYTYVDDMHTCSIKACTHTHTHIYARVCNEKFCFLIPGFRSRPFCGPHILQKTEIGSTETQGMLRVRSCGTSCRDIWISYQVLQLYCEVFGEHVPLPSLLGSYFHISKDIVQVIRAGYAYLPHESDDVRVFH